MEELKRHMLALSRVAALQKHSLSPIVNKVCPCIVQLPYGYYLLALHTALAQVRTGAWHAGQQDRSIGSRCAALTGYVPFLFAAGFSA